MFLVAVHILQSSHIVVPHSFPYGNVQVLVSVKLSCCKTLSFLIICLLSVVSPIFSPLTWSSEVLLIHSLFLPGRYMSYDWIFYYNSCFFYIFFCYGINHAVPLFPDKIINAYPSFHPFFRISTYNIIVFWLIFLPCICFVLYKSKRLVTSFSTSG